MSAATEPRWYSVNNMGMATLCADKADAEDVARTCDIDFPRQAPHRAVQLVEVPAPLVAAPDDSKLAACFDQIKSELIADGAVEHDLTHEFFPEAVLDAFRRQRAARIEAQQRLADAQELAAKSGLAHRMAVQRCVQAAVAEAVAAEREACAVVCESLFVPDQVLGAHPDYLEGKHMAKSQCASNIRARGTP